MTGTLSNAYPVEYPTPWQHGQYGPTPDEVEEWQHRESGHHSDHQLHASWKHANEARAGHELGERLGFGEREGEERESVWSERVKSSLKRGHLIRFKGPQDLRTSVVKDSVSPSGACVPNASATLCVRRSSHTISGSS